MLLDKIIGMLAPHICVGCGQEGTLLCETCGDILYDPAIYLSQDSLNSVRSVTSYEEFARDLVWQFKFRGAQAAAGIMARYMTPLIGADDADAIIVPVPTATRRVRQRGFDQAKLLAHQLSRRAGLRYVDCLRRRGQTHQVGANREQRLQQLQSAFQLKRGVPRDSQLILVDDVMTTGATLEAAALVLQAADPRHIDAVVFAYTHKTDT